MTNTIILASPEAAYGKRRGTDIRCLRRPMTGGRPVRIKI